MRAALLSVLAICLACSSNSGVAPAVDAGFVDAGEIGPDVSTGCAAPKIVCGATCIDPSADATNCGVCGFACGATERCCAGACSTDCATAIGTVSPNFGPMSGSTWLTVTGKGFAKPIKAWVGGSRAPAMLVDASTVKVLTPPGRARAVDVKIASGAATSTRAAAFRYERLGLEGTWRKVDMTSPRGNWPGIAVLHDGRVLISGGVTTSSGASVTDTADLWDPVTSKVTMAAGKMSAPRWTQASVTMLTGQTLVLGTWMGGYSPPTGPVADLFDPATNTFKRAGTIAVEHRWPHAALMANGSVVVASYELPGLQVYDPIGDRFVALTVAKNSAGYRPTRLLDGRILLVHGGGARTWLWDPDTDAFDDVGDGPAATDGDLYTLPDGRAMWVAGSIVTTTNRLPTDAIEIFEPGKTGFAKASFKLSQPRQRWVTTAMAGDGTVLVIGGAVGPEGLSPACAVDTFVLTDGVERIDAAAGTVVPFDKLPEKNFVLSSATTLDGSVIAAGGAPCGGGMAYPYFYFLKGSAPR